MNKIEELVKEIAPAKEERPKTYTAEVSHTDEEGVVWVRLPGAEQDTPTASTSTDVKMGDTVTVEWRNNKLYIAGNYTNPSAGVTRVSKVEQTAEKAMSDAGTARAAAETAQKTANDAITIAGDTDQHFWFTETGTDTGAHITEATQEDFLADPTNGGGNLLARSNGIAVRDGLSELASFSASGAQIGKTSGAHTTISASGMQIYKDATTQLANIGYGEGQAQTGTANAPYYSLGKRTATGAADIGNYSMAEGYNTKARGYASHAEGYRATASADSSHAEGRETNASGGASHAEGDSTTASGELSHAEGGFTIARGFYSHAQNTWTIAGYLSQTSIGRYNDNQANSAFEIGNGSADDARSNAFTVDWDGNTTAAGTITVEGHSSPIGTRLTGTRESTAGTATTSYTTAAHIDLTAGTWLITGFNSFNGGTAGRRAILITGSSTATYDAAEGSASGYAAASMHIALSTSLIVTPTGNATYYLRIKSASQVDSPIGNLAAVRIA